MSKANKIEGYKVFDPDWKCGGFQFEIGGIFEEDVIPSCCHVGFHFCKELKDCFNYYSFNPDNKVAKVIALGEVDEKSGDSKCCTNKIQIVEELSWEDVLHMVNSGKGNNGNRNTGDYNSGNRNTGNHNSGKCNTGDYNSGNWNTGNYNSGNRNSGHCNGGSYNSGNHNSGKCNTGDYNSGNWNSGNHNSGSYNTGDWNKTNFSNGCFNTEKQKIHLFNKPSDWTDCDWLGSEAKNVLDMIPTHFVQWISTKNMTDEEMDAHQSYKTTGGYLKTFDKSNCRQEWWDGLCEEDQNIVKELPNFDAEIFFQCTGIKVNNRRARSDE